MLLGVLERADLVQWAVVEISLNRTRSLPGSQRWKHLIYKMLWLEKLQTQCKIIVIFCLNVLYFMLGHSLPRSHVHF
jgi:hypothetical protein